MKSTRSYLLISLSIVLGVLIGCPAVADIRFEDVTAASGADQSPHRESYGAAWGDLNGDGYPDLFVSNHWTPSSLFQNTGHGTFTDVAQQVNALAHKQYSDTHGGTWFDINNDGQQDLLIPRGAGTGNPPMMLVNQGGVLTDQTQSLGLANETWQGRMPIWFDYNGDGLPDLVMVVTGTKTANGQPDSKSPVQVLKQISGGFVLDPNTVDGNCIRQQYGQLLYDSDEGRLNFLCPNGPIFPRALYNPLSSPWQLLTSLFPTVPVSPAFPNVPGVPGGSDSAIADFDNDGRMDVFVLSGMDTRPSGAEINKEGTRLEAGLIGDGAVGSRGFSFKASGPISFKVASNVFYETNLNSSWIHYGSNGTSPPPITNPDASNPEDYAKDHSSVFTLNPADSSVAGTPSGVDAPSLLIGYDPATGLWTVTLEAQGGGTGDAVGTEAYVEVTGTGLNSLQVQGLVETDKPTRPTLLMNHPGGFTDETAAWGLSDAIQCGSVVAGDFNNDMYPDLYLVCRTAVSNTENILLENVPRSGGGRTFVRVDGDGGAGGPVGFAVGDGAGTGDSVVTADYDVDGFLDLFVTNGLNMFPKGNGGGNRLFHNVGNTNRWIELDLVATKGVREAVGAVVKVSANGVTQMHVKDGGYHRWSQNFTRMHFGLAQAATADLTIQWPSGTVETYSNVASNHLYRATEGSGIQAMAIGGSANNGGTGTSSQSPSPHTGGGGGGSMGVPSLIELAFVAFLWRRRKRPVSMPSVDPALSCRSDHGGCHE